MAIIGLGLLWILRGLFWLFMGRFVADILFSLNPGFRPSGIFLAIIEIVMTITDWPMRKIRKVIKPVRIGAAAIDFSWTIVLVIISVLQNAVVKVFF